MDSRTYIGENAAKRACQSGGPEKERDAKLSFPPLVPHAKVIDDAGEQAGLGDAKEEARDEEARQVVDDAHQGGHDTPEYRQRGKPEPGRGSLEDDVAGDLKDDISHKVERQAGEILVPRHVQVGRETLDPGVSHVAAVQEGEQVQDANGWEKADIELSKQRLFVDVVELDVVRVRGSRLAPLLTVIKHLSDLRRRVGMIRRGLGLCVFGGHD